MTHSPDNLCCRSSDVIAGFTKPYRRVRAPIYQCTEVTHSPDNLCCRSSDVMAGGDRHKIIHILPCFIYYVSIHSRVSLSVYGIGDTEVTACEDINPMSGYTFYILCEVLIPLALTHGSAGLRFLLTHTVEPRFTSTLVTQLRRHCGHPGTVPIIFAIAECRTLGPLTRTPRYSDNFGLVPWVTIRG